MKDVSLYTPPVAAVDFFLAAAVTIRTSSYPGPALLRVNVSNRY